jgi:multidrug transporter EmrE-like cation transporter
VLWFNEPVAALQIVSIAAIIGRVVGLYLSGDVH